MAARWEQITELYQETAREATASPSHWRAFLTSACRNYRLPFDEQILLYAQRPDATAVLEIERWNQRFGRWVNRGAKGIAVFDRERPNRLRYYFDVADTHETRTSQPVPLWTVREEYVPDIVETLENSFGELEHKEDFGDALLSAARNAVEDNLGDYLAELGQLTQGSLLEELDGDSLGMQFRTLAGNSVAAMLLARCGVDPSGYLGDEDFREIGNFNTPETCNALGIATRDIARMCLDEIARTALPLERQAEKEIRTVANTPTKGYAEAREPENLSERSQNHGSDLHQAGGLPAAESPATPGGAGSPGQVRPDAETLSAGAPEHHLHQPADQREIEHSSGRNPADRPAPDGGDHSADGESPGRDGGAESQRPHEVGGADEQPTERGGGNGAGGADLQLNTPQDNGDIGRPSQESQQMSLFDFGEAKAYDLGYGHLGNGLTVWNRLEEEHGDYKTVAHIAPDRTVTFYEEDMPQAVREEIQRVADTSEMTVSATQDAPVFTVPPREQPPQKEESLPPPPTRPRREGITFTTLHPEIPPEQRRNFRITDGHLGEGGVKTKFRNNVAAIQTLQKIESEGRLATPEEQEILSRYVGWGGLPQAFDENNRPVGGRICPAAKTFVPRGIRGRQGHHPQRPLHFAHRHPGHLSGGGEYGLPHGQHPGAFLRHWQLLWAGAGEHDRQPVVWRGAGPPHGPHRPAAVPAEQHHGAGV